MSRGVVLFAENTEGAKALVHSLTPPAPFSTLAVPREPFPPPRALAPASLPASEVRGLSSVPRVHFSRSVVRAWGRGGPRGPEKISASAFRRSEEE
eukprot:scaffold69872_cov72-Phaeocystis_antarctica.AAC.1